MSQDASDDDGITELAEAIYREKIRRARQQAPIEKLRDGLRLHEYASRITLAGIHHQHPGISAADALRILKERVATQRRRDQVQ